MELVLRSWRREKSDDQRRLWHAVIADAAPHFHLTPAEMKLLVKRLYFGIEIKTVSLIGREVTVEVIQSSEGLDRKEYSALIDATYQLCAEQGINIPDRRPR